MWERERESECGRERVSVGERESEWWERERVCVGERESVCGRERE